MNGLFIKKFKTPQQYYIYAPCSNEIVQVNSAIWDIIEQFHKPVEQIHRDLAGRYTKTEITDALQAIGKAKESGVFGNHRPTINSHRKNRKEILYLFENAGIQQLVIDLTNQCNMRCKYCIFSGKYTYRDKTISRETAIKAVDYFIKHSDKKDTPALGPRRAVNDSPKGRRRHSDIQIENCWPCCMPADVFSGVIFSFFSFSSGSR